MNGEKISFRDILNRISNDIELLYKIVGENLVTSKGQGGMFSTIHMILKNMEHLEHQLIKLSPKIKNEKQ